MKSLLRPLLVVSAIWSLASCDKPMPPAAAAPMAAETDNQLAEARDALQRQALEIETKTALMDKQLAEMAQSLKERDNAELRDSLDALKRQNDELRVQADAARQQSNAITQRIVVTPQPNVVPQPMALPDYSLFYDRLEPYGRWFEVNGYGYCWRPTITVAGWRPYVDGCWVWSSLGWAWQSNEPFGWATYHYGRWVNLARYGWIWVPGSDWAPAWVAWRQSRDCVGWAPLPPETGVFSGAYRDCDSRYGLGPSSYTFINTTQFVSPTYINIYAPVTRQTTIFQHSVNVTQIVPSHSRGHAFVHQGGPPRAQMEQACGHPVPQRQVQTMHADQMPTRPQHHGRRDADAPVAMVELPAVAPGGHMRRPEIKERIQKPVLMGGFEGVPQQAAREIRENIAQEKETAVVQQQPPPMRGHMQHGFGRRPVEPPNVVNAPPAVPSVLTPQTVKPASAAESPGVAPAIAPVETAAVPQQPGQGSMPQGSRRHSPEGRPATNTPAQETVRPAVAAELGADAAREPRRHGQPGARAPQAPDVPPESKVVENSPPAAASSTPAVMPAVVENKAPEPPAAPVVPVAAPSTPAVMPAVVESKAPEPSAAPVVPVVAPERAAPPAVVSAPPAVMPQPPADPIVSQQPVAAKAETTRMHAGREQAHAAAMEQRRQQEMQDRGQAEKRAAEQAAANAEAEKSRMQAAAAQQEAQAAQQQRMAADQAAAETEKARQQAAATAAQQQQEMAAQQQRATAERMASEQAAAAEAERVRQQTEAAAMQQSQQEEATRRAAAEQQMKSQQETERRGQEMAAQRQAEEQARRQQEAEMQRVQEQARRAAEEQQMKSQQETERRSQEMAAQRQAEEQARRQQEAEMQRSQEQARRAAEEQQMRAQQEAAQRAQEMAQRQAEEQARRQQEAEMQRAQEQARRAAEEQQMRAQQEAAQRAQEMAQRQAEEQARRVQEMAQRQAEEQARRAQEEAQRAAAEAAQRASEAARNQPQPAPGS